MIVVMAPNAKSENTDKVINKLKKEGFEVHLSQGVSRTIIGIIGDKTRLTGLALEAMSGVEKVVPILRPFKLAGRDFKPENSTVEVTPEVKFGGKKIHVIAGPCAVEGEDQLMEIAKEVKAQGATLLRGGAFKPRTSPYSFQGLGEEGLKILAAARQETGLPIVTEVMDIGSISLVAKYADVLQVGARNMQNFFLLKELGRIQKPILLKRGPSATIEEWILAAEYIMSEGNHNVILCERGIRTFETYTRNTLDLSAVPAAKNLSHLPVVVDPSHGTGKWSLVAPMAKAAIAAGADGLMIETHCRPEEAFSDGQQSLTPKNFGETMKQLHGLAGVMGREL